MRYLDVILKVKREGITKEILEVCTKDELKMVHAILDEIEDTGSSETLDILWKEDFEERPVSIDEFLENDYYLGKVGSDVYPKWRDELRVICSPFENISEWIVKGSIGSGKTYSAVIALIYKMYYLSCLRNPQSFYGLGKGTPIVFGFFNIYKYLVKATSYQYLVSWLRDNSPYFKRWRIPKQKRESDKDVLTLPKNLRIALGAQAIHALGQNLVGGILDETEFGKTKSMSSQEKSQVADLYEQVRERIDSRFMQGGGANPGILILVSSAKDYESFIEPHSRAKRDDDRVRQTAFALYEVKEDRFKDSKRFKVVVGDRFHQSHIMEPDEIPRDGARIVEVPEEFRSHFEYDIDSSVRNICGIPTHGEILFYPQRDQLKLLLESCKRKHPFSMETIELSIEDDTPIDDYFLLDEVTTMIMKSAKVRKPIYYPQVTRYVHVDLAKNHDCAGVSMVCLPFKRTVDRPIDDKIVRLSELVVFVDFMLRIRASFGSEIDLGKISAFIFFLRKVGRFRIKKVTYDQFQSLESIQKFKKAKIDSKEFSVDRNPGPYRTLKQVCREGRFDAYYYEPFYSEMTTLEDRTNEGGSVKNKIDHPPHGSKDVADSVCGATASGLLDKKGITDVSAHEEQKRRAVVRAAAVQQAASADPRKPPGGAALDRMLVGQVSRRSVLNALFEGDNE